MHHAHIKDTDVLSSPDYKDSFIIARPTESQAERVRYWASEEPAPRAERQGEVWENCQGWTVRVIARLVTERVMGERWVDVAVGMQQPVQ